MIGAVDENESYSFYDDIFQTYSRRKQSSTPSISRAQLDLRTSTKRISQQLLHNEDSQQPAAQKVDLALLETDEWSGWLNDTLAKLDHNDETLSLTSPSTNNKLTLEQHISSVNIAEDVVKDNSVELISIIDDLHYSAEAIHDDTSSEEDPVSAEIEAEPLSSTSFNKFSGAERTSGASLQNRSRTDETAVNYKESKPVYEPSAIKSNANVYSFFDVDSSLNDSLSLYPFERLTSNIDGNENTEELVESSPYHSEHSVFQPDIRLNSPSPSNERSPSNKSRPATMDFHTSDETTHSSTTNSIDDHKANDLPTTCVQISPAFCPKGKLYSQSSKVLNKSTVPHPLSKVTKNFGTDDLEQDSPSNITSESTTGTTEVLSGPLAKLQTPMQLKRHHMLTEILFLIQITAKVTFI